MLYGLPAWSQSYTTGGITAVDTSATCATTGGSVVINVIQNASSIAFNVSGTFSATLQFVATVDGSRWDAVQAFPPNSSTGVTSTTSGGTWKADVANYAQFCVRASAYVSGTATVGMRNGPGVSTSALSGGGGASSFPNQTANTVFSGPTSGGAAAPAFRALTTADLPNDPIPASPGYYYVSTACPTVAANCYTVHADIQAVSDATFTAGAHTVATGSSDPPFCNGSSLPCTAAQIAQGHTTDVGMVAVGLDNCNANNEMACNYNCAQTTIATVVDNHDITLTGTCTRNSSATANSNNFYWGQDDSTQLTAAWTAATNYAQLTGPATLQLPCGRMGMGSSSFVVWPASVMRYQIGLNGCGEGNPTEIVPFPKMNCTANAGGLDACLLILIAGNDVLGNFSFNSSARNILFNGYGLPDKDSSATVSTGWAGIAAGFGSNLYNVGVQGWMWNRSSATTLYGLFCSGCSAYGVNIYAGGNIGTFLQGSLTAGQLFGGSTGGSTGPSLDIGGNETSTHGVYINQNETSCFNTNACYGVRNLTSGSNYTDYGSFITTGIWTDSGAKSTLVGSWLTGVGTTYSYYQNGGILALSNVHIVGHAHLVSGTVLDMGGNTAPSAYSGLDAFTGGSFAADGHSVKGICTGTATSSSTLGLFGTGPNETTTTCTSTTIGTGLVVTGARTLSGLMVTATHAGVSASSGVVTVMQNGNTTTITCTVGTGTSCSDFTHSVTTADGDRISIQFTTQGSEVLAGVNAFVEWQ